MITLSAVEASRLGYKQVGKALRFVGPDGTVYSRCLFGRPSLCITGLQGEKLHLSVVPQRKARTA